MADSALTFRNSGTQNQIDKNRLVKALQLCKNRSYNFDFAWGNEISGIETLMKSLHVEGIGNVLIPIAKKTVEKLKTVAVQAPYGKGLNTVLDTSKRYTWQIDAAKVSAPSTVADNYFCSSITPALVKLAMTKLGLPTNDATAVEAHLCKMLLYEPGGHFKKHCRDTEKDAGIFGTMVLQIPVRGGHQGGSLLVEHNGKIKKFPFDVQSEKKFFLAAFYADCERELEPVTKGWRVTLLFDLVWKHQMPAVNVPIILPVLLDVLNEIKESLRPWTTETDCVVQLPTISTANDEIAIDINDAASSTPSISKYEDSEVKRRLSSIAFKDCFESYMDKGVISVSYRRRDSKPPHESFEPDLIYFLLNHKCSSYTNVKFSELEGQDYLLALLLQSCPDFDVHLAVIEQHTSKSEYDEEENNDCKRSFEIGLWTNTNNTPIELHGLDVNLKSQIVGSFSKLLNLTNTPPAKETKVHTGDEGRETNRWYYHLVLVVWPKCQTNRIYFKYNFNGMLSLLEKQVQPTLEAFTHRCSREDSLEDLRKLLHFCHVEPWIAWKEPAADEARRIVRLLNLCIVLEAKAEGLFLLDLLGKEFVHQGATFYEGIRNHQVAEAVAEFECRVGGWTDSAKFIMEIVSSTHVLHDLLPYIQLVYLLLDRYCLDGAKDVAGKICDQVKSSLDTVHTLPHPEVEALVKMMLHLQSDVKTSNEQTISLISSFLPNLNGDQLGLLIINLQAEVKSVSVHSLQPYHLTTLEETCRRFLSLEPSGLVKNSSHDILVKVLESVIRLKNDAFVLGMADKISSALLLKNFWTQTTKFNVLISIITSVDIWGELPDSSKTLILAASVNVLQDWKSSLLVPKTSSSQFLEETFNFQDIQVAFQLFIALEKINANSTDSGI